MDCARLRFRLWRRHGLRFVLRFRLRLNLTISKGSMCLSDVRVPNVQRPTVRIAQCGTHTPTRCAHHTTWTAGRAESRFSNKLRLNRPRKLFFHRLRFFWRFSDQNTRQDKNKNVFCDRRKSRSCRRFVLHRIFDFDRAIAKFLRLKQNSAFVLLISKRSAVAKELQSQWLGSRNEVDHVFASAVELACPVDHPHVLLEKKVKPFNFMTIDWPLFGHCRVFRNGQLLYIH